MCEMMRSGREIAEAESAASLGEGGALSGGREVKMMMVMRPQGPLSLGINRPR